MSENDNAATETQAFSAPSLPLLILGAGISAIHVWFNLVQVLPGLLQNALHFAGFAVMCVLLYPLGKGENRRLRGLNLAFGLIAALAALYMIGAEDAIYERGVRLALAEWVFGIYLIIAAIELTRRTTGMVIPVLIVLALSYVGWWGAHLDGVFRFVGLSSETILFRSIYGDDGLFGSIARISSSYVFMFILFGAFLLRSGAGEFVIDLARAVAGRMIGGPGLVAVIASGLTGTISGSAVANTASTGCITIPLMKRAGFSGRFAAGVEASASTGGQLMPPIMGAGAFVMASTTQIPYTTIVLVSILPALLYFATVGFFVRVEAKKLRLDRIEDAPLSAMAVLKKGGLPFLLPICVLIGLLIYGYTPTYAAGVSIIAVVVSSWFTRRRMGLRAIIEAMALGARNMVMTAILLCSVGLIVNVIAMTGIGNTFSLMITQWAGNSLIIALVLIALASLVLGMGLPVTAAYIVLGTLSAPALYALMADAQIVNLLQLGALPESAKAILAVASPDNLAALAAPMDEVAAQALIGGLDPDIARSLRDLALTSDAQLYVLLSAHLIVFWLSQDSNVTPPVCLAAFTAAAIAKSPPMATGIQSWKIAKGLYLVPLLFAYTPLVAGNWIELSQIFFFALLGMYAFTGTLQGHLEAPLSLLSRSIAFACAALLIWPSGLALQSAAAVIFIGLIILNIRRRMPETSKIPLE